MTASRPTTKRTSPSVSDGDIENKGGHRMTDHQILALILLVCVVLLVIGLRIMLIVSREVRETITMSRLTLDAVSKLLQQQR